LNPEQQSAVEHFEGPLLVLAGAGSGKTRCVTLRIVHLLERGVPPTSILGLTFTNKAAQEMQGRVERLTRAHVLISTFHSLGARILREQRPGFTIYDEEDARRLLKGCVRESGGKETDVRLYKNMISAAKNALEEPSEENFQDPLLFAVYRCYQEHLAKCNACDFDDLLYLPVKLFRERPDILEQYQKRWRFLLIDEYQDTNAAQYALCRLLVQKSGNIFSVGDPDQSIYSWRGADIGNILNFEKDYPGAKVVRLEQNYRSRSNILEAANALIAQNEGRYEKKLWSDLGEGEKIVCFCGGSEGEEARFVARTVQALHEREEVPLGEMAVFYRTNSQSRIFEDVLLERRIPYRIIGGVSFYQRREIKDILAFLRVVYSDSDFVSFARTLNLPKRGIGQATLEKIREGALSSGRAVLDYCREALSGAVRLTKKQREGLEAYLALIGRLKERVREGSLEELVTATVQESGYLQHLALDPETEEERRENLDELAGKAIEWDNREGSPGLAGFLEELSLKSGLDELDPSDDRLCLMTLHNGKGLEFDTVFITGLEEELLPHANARDSLEALEEERRLCYVGMTRAKERLYLTHALQRRIWGQSRRQRPSRFLREIPGPFFRGGEEEAVEAGEDFSPGDAVYHKDFGIGIVKDSYEGSQGLTYEILFSKERRPKSLVARFARLVRL